MDVQITPIHNESNFHLKGRVRDFLIYGVKSQCSNWVPALGLTGAPPPPPPHPAQNGSQAAAIVKVFGFS